MVESTEGSSMKMVRKISVGPSPGAYGVFICLEQATTSTCSMNGE